MGGTIRSLAPEYPIVEVVSTGTVSRTDAEQAMAVIADLCATQGIWAVLDDSRDMVHTLAPRDIVDLVDALVARGIDDRFRLALVRPTDVMAATWSGLWETAATNRGLRVRVFRDRDTAIAWLVSS